MAGLSHFERIGGGRDSDQLVTDSSRPQWRVNCRRFQLYYWLLQFSLSLIKVNGWFYVQTQSVPEEPTAVFSGAVKQAQWCCTHVSLDFTNYSGCSSALSVLTQYIQLTDKKSYLPAANGDSEWTHETLMTTANKQIMLLSGYTDSPCREKD